MNNTGNKQVSIMKQTSFRREKNREYRACLKYSVLHLLNKYIKCNFWRLAVGTTHIWVVRRQRVNILEVPYGGSCFENPLVPSFLSEGFLGILGNRSLVLPSQATTTSKQIFPIYRSSHLSIPQNVSCREHSKTNHNNVM